eukprot:TRINITY_DN11459_c0_g1_i2.p1 TRINITY_DN11459_c0_g1~~TRINITY_DN11459_c0_g1_i2.p1  ORF type:complete len:707 (-),score=136.08 TRINITY_DN11459_c0_g1_i2:30-2150(-)
MAGGYLQGEVSAAQSQDAASLPLEMPSTGDDAADRPAASLRQAMWTAVGMTIPAKEMKEACAFYDAVRKDARRRAGSSSRHYDVVIDACGGHGALGMLCVAHGLAAEGVVIDQSQPGSFAKLLEAWAAFCPASSIAYQEGRIQERLPTLLKGLAARPARVLVVACHACQHLADSIIDTCIEAQVDFMVCPCCPKDHQGGIQNAAAACGVDFGKAMTIAQMGRILGVTMGRCDVRLRTFDESVSPLNRIIVGRFACSIQDLEGGAGQHGNMLASKMETADDKLRRAYERAHRQDTTSGAAAEAGAVKSVDSKVHNYEQQLAEKVSFLNNHYGTLGALPELEIRRSPDKQFRFRTAVAVGEDESPEVAERGLYRFVWDSSLSKFNFVSNFSVDTLAASIGEALPMLADLLSADSSSSLRQDLVAVKLHAALGGTPPQLLVCLIYRQRHLFDRGCGSLEAALDGLRIRLQDRMAAAGCVCGAIVMAQAKGVQCSMPSNCDFVDETLPIDGRSVRYRQPFGQFSNPNPHIAIATAEWMLDCIRSTTAPQQCDLLELYCGAGSHTMALAPHFRHVLAVEINRRLVDAATGNVSANGLDNVTVVRSPSNDFCRRVLQRRCYDLKGSDGSVKRLSFGCTIVDPPRAGLDATTLEAIAGYDHVLYISCNPLALRKDMESLLATHEVVRWVLLDHFPFTAHVETAAYFRRRHADP